jgi:hypothetical protein
MSVDVKLKRYGQEFIPNELVVDTCLAVPTFVQGDYFFCVYHGLIYYVIDKSGSSFWHSI